MTSPETVTDIERILITCGALDGSCAGALIRNTAGNVDEATPGQCPMSSHSWRQPTTCGPLMHDTLRRIAQDSLSHRPDRPPDLLVVRLDEPLAPPRAAQFGERLLPSAVLEMTPGFVPQLIARSWGFVGPALCIVGQVNGVNNDWDLPAVCRRLGLTTAQVEVSGTGDNREIVWNV